jgi:hypothetical protein
MTGSSMKYIIIRCEQKRQDKDANMDLFHPIYVKCNMCHNNDMYYEYHGHKIISMLG